jgi:hypothetical protein
VPKSKTLRHVGSVELTKRAVIEVANRVFVVGTPTETEAEYWNGLVVIRQRTALRKFIATVRTEIFVAVQQREALDTDTVARRGGDVV